MQVVRVTTKDSESAKLLVVQLAGLFGGEQVSLQADGEVQVQLPELDGELVKTLKAVECWLEQSGIASAEVSVNEHSYTVEHPERAETSTAPSRSDGSARRACGRRPGRLTRGGRAGMSSEAVTAAVSSKRPLGFFSSTTNGQARHVVPRASSLRSYSAAATIRPS